MKNTSIPGPLRAGFSLAELMVVIVIIGLLATLVVPNVMQRFEWAKRETAKVEIRQIESSAQQFALMNSGRFPDELPRLTAPDVNGVAFLDASLKDPWQTDYAYQAPSEAERRPWIASFAADRAPGGVGWDEDIENWTLDENL